MQVDIELYRRPVRVATKGGSACLSAIDIAPETPRRTLLFLHGFGGASRQWIHQLKHFSDQDRAIALDLRGHGRSDPIDGPYDVETLIGDLENALQALGVEGPVTLISHSFGAAIAVDFALRHPEKVDRLVLIAAAEEYPLAWHLRTALRLPLTLQNVIYPFVRGALSAPPRVLKKMYYEAVLHWRGGDRFRALRVPTLVIRGHRDRVFARQFFERVSLAIANAEDVNVGASGHMVMLERRDAVNRAIERFLDGPRTWREPGPRMSLLKARRWVAHYDPGVPYTIGVPPIALDEFLSSAARRFPLRPAILFEGTRLTYRRLDREVNRLSHALIRLGVQPGDRVMLVLPNLPQTVISFYAALRAGAVVAFATPLSEPDELLREIRDAAAVILVTLTQRRAVAARALKETELRHVIYTGVEDYLPRFKSTLYALRMRTASPDARLRKPGRDESRFLALLRSAPADSPNLTIGSEGLAVLQYTGGTTALPKGVMLSHRNLVANTLQTRHWIPEVQDGKEVVLSVLPFSHIYGLTTALSVPVAMAGAMVILPTFSTRQVLRAIRKTRPTLFPGVPTMYTALNDFPGVRRFRVDSIRACISGAAPLPIEVQEAFERLTRGRLVEGYGLTEASPVTHANPLSGRRKVGSIGIPFPSTEAKIVDIATGRDLAPGRIGELAVRGPQVMLGYWKEPEATRQVLTRGGWLMTGDLARMDEDGYFQIIARKKEMILAGDYQVFPRDVEEVLYEHPKVREAAVVGIQRSVWPFQRVKAFVVLRSGEDASEEELIELCRRRLESYAVPWKIEFVDDLPKSFVGKVLRRLLIEREVDGQEMGPMTPPGSGSPTLDLSAIAGEEN